MNALWRYFDELGFPWRMLRGDLEARYGVVHHPLLGAPVIEIPSFQAFVPGLLWPLATLSFGRFCLDMPATTFASQVQLGETMEETLNSAVGYLRPFLGEGARVTWAGGIQYAWVHGPSLVRLRTNILAGRPSGSVVATAEPRLNASCELRIDTGHLRTWP